MKLVFDIETNGLIDATKIWCIVAKDIETNQIYTYNPEQIDSGLELLADADLLVGHNILGFDIPIIEKLAGLSFKNKKVIDTLVLSRLANPQRGKHSLKAWGFNLGFNKGSMEEHGFTHYSDEMLEYCINDVELNSKVFNVVLKELEGFDSKSIELEHGVSVILKEQEFKGFLFDEQKGSVLLAELRERKAEIEETVQKVFKPKLVKLKTVQPKWKKNGCLSKQGLTDEEFLKIISKPKHAQLLPFDRCKLQEFNLGSRKQIGEYLQDFGWKPKKFTPTGQPIVDESTLNTVQNIPEAQLISKFLMLQKRVAQVQSWFDKLEDDQRVHGFVIHNGAVTGRMSHVSPNLAQIPASYSPYGKDCRSCWIVPNGYKLVGIDASGLELRMLAHYMNDEGFKNEILNGDIHTANQKLAGLESRDQAKTFIYALIYGGSDLRLGQVVGGNRNDGKRLRKSFLDNLPSFATLKDRVERATAKGYLKGLDGRKVFIRSEHAALNTLLQSAGAVVMKQALINLNNKIKENALDAHFVANVHDEWQIEVIEHEASKVGELGVESIRQVEQDFNLRCPLDGEYKIGNNWSETH